MSHKENQTMKQLKIKINYKFYLKTNFTFLYLKNMKFYFT